MDGQNKEQLLARIAELEQEKAKLEQEKAKMNGTYWRCIEDVWDSKEEPFKGGLAKFQGLRGMTKPIPENYKSLLYACNSGEGTETVLHEYRDEDRDSVYSVSTCETGSANAPKESAGKGNHRSKHLKTLSGVCVRRHNKSKAHLIPHDVECNKFWFPVLQLALGPLVKVSDETMRLASGLHTNKLVFDMNHMHHYDDLDYGNILAIPIFESVAAMREWEYKKPYDMLIVCDKSGTYKVLGLYGTSEQPHIKNATELDVHHVTSLLSEATKMLAESLVKNWDPLYNKFEDTKQKQRMENMREELKEEKVKVPFEKEVSEPKLYKVCFGDLYNNEETSKYIPDPFLLLVKAAVNLSAVHYGPSKKLLQACLSASSEESVNVVSLEGSRESSNTVEQPQGTSGFRTIPNKIRIVSDHDEDDSSSEVTF